MDRLARTLSFALLAMLPARGQEPVDQARADELLTAAKAKLAPDRRTVVFDVTVKVDGERLTLSGEVHDELLELRLISYMGKNTGCVVVDKLRALPDPTLGEQTMGIVCVSVANLRVQPGHSKELGTQALLGTPLRILKKQGGWSYVQTPNDYLCWTNDRFQPMTKPEFATWQQRPKVIVTATFAIVRESLDADSRPVGDVVAGCILSVEPGRHGGGFVRVGYADGRTGYLPKSAVAALDDWLEQTRDAPTSIVATARRFIGVPYLWGGTSCKGMDCSGFTSTVFFLNGVLLPRDASQQVLVGQSVEIDAAMSQVQAGDLLFFGGQRVTHVGISLGGARFIHSSTDVHENSLDPEDPDFSPSLQRRLLGVRRIIGAGGDVGVRRLAELDYYKTP